MDFLGDIWRNVQSFFGGGEKKKRDEERRQVNRAVTSSAPRTNQSSNPFEETKAPKLNTPQNVFKDINKNLMLPGSTPVITKPTKPVVQQKSVQQELDELAQKNMDKALEDTRRGRDFWGAASDFFTGNDKKIATQNARNRAVSQYQEKKGWKKDPEVMRYIGGTRDLGGKTSRELKTQNENLDRFERGANKVASVAQYVPVTGSVMNLGLAAADKAGNADARTSRRQIDFGMTNSEYEALDPEIKGKLETMQNIGLALSPLDFLGLGGIAKSGVVGAGKKALINTVKREVIDEAAKQTLRTAGRGAIKTAMPASIIGGGASAGAQAYLTGEVDPIEAAKAAILGGGASMLIPNVNTRQVPVTRSIEVDAPRTYNKRVPVVSKPSERPMITDLIENPGLQPKPVQPIRELAGDTPGVNRVEVPTADETATTRFAEQPVIRPDRRVEGMVPGRMEDTTLYTKAEIDTERAALDEALANGEINKTQYKAANKELDGLTASDAPRTTRKIEVKEVRDIPVDEMSSMPNPVKVDESAPAKANADEFITEDQKVYSEALESRIPVVRDNASEFILSNPKRFTKRQVAAARNQRKLARQMAKTKEQTAEAVERIDSVSPERQTDEGFAPTGEFGKSVNGGAYEKTSRATEMQAAIQETANLSPGDVIRTARANQAETGGFNRRDIRNIAALIETKRIERGTPEWQEARQILKEDGTVWGQQGALRNYTMRRNASADELVGRFESKIYRLADDPTRIDGKLFDEVELAETRFVETRDAATAAYNRFTEQPTTANAKAYHAAQDAADKADREAKTVEYKVANAALKGNKDIQQVRELEKMAQSADMYQMDAVDASMLSGTGTFVRNFVNASVGGLEEGIFGRMSAKLASMTPKSRQNNIKVGGGIGRGSAGGFKQGAVNVVDASKARAGAAGKNPLEHIKNWATTGNQAGDSVIDGQASRNTLSHYTQMLKDQGYKGSELRDRASVMARQDPDNVSETYTHAARVAAGLGSGITRNNKVETLMKNVISDALSGGNPNKYTEGAAKLATRMTLGFPTAITRSAVEGVKRFTLGAPTFIKAMRTQDPQTRAILVKEGIKQAGTGATVIPPLFFALGNSGMITGSYPEDQSERERWAREGITENAVKIGDDYYQLPAYLGAWALPGLFYASLGRNNGDFAAAAADSAKVIPSLLPVDSMDKWIDFVNGRSDPGKFFSQMASSAVRAATPGGALLNQLGKSIDPTQNDTNSGTAWENFIDKVINGIPGANLTLDAKTDAEGNPLANPDPVALAFGAASTVQDKGVEQSAVLDEQTNEALGSMNSYGAFSDPNLKAVITDEKTKKIYSDIVAGKQVNPDDLKKVQEAMVKGVSEKGTDTAYLEREQYDTHLTALQVKRELMASDPTQRPSDLEKLDVAIKRGEIYRDNQLPYELISEYQETSLEEWRKMGDPDSDDYNEEMYQQLWAMDELMTKNGVSYKKGALDKQKFYAKSSGSRGGSRGGAGSKMSTDFGTLKAGTGAPSVQAYDTIEQRSGGVPVINVQRPNIVHKIGFSG